MAGAAPVCHYLPWDSTFFGLRIGQTDIHRLTPETASQLARWCRDEAIDCLYFLADADHQPTTALAHANGFDLVDIRVTLEHRLDEPQPAGTTAAPGLVRGCQPDDIARLGAIARCLHHDSRFYFDPGFTRARCDALYEHWLVQSCQGYADAVHVAVLAGEPVGYVTCHLDAGVHGRIGLLGVAASAQGHGAGGQLARAALAWFASQGARAATVVTQGRNLGAQRLYQRAGFCTQSVQLWYHWWPRKKEAPR